MLDREGFVKTLLGLAEAFGRELSSPTIGVYYAALRDLPPEEWTRAVERCATTCTRMPAPAELRALAGEHTAQERAITAWTEATRAARSVGSYRSVTFEDVAINAAIRSLGGWVAFCAADAEEVERFWRPRFVEAHKAYARSVPASLAEHLPGLIERGTVGGKVERVTVPASTPLPGGGPKVLAAPAQLALLTGGSR